MLRSPERAFDQGGGKRRAVTFVAPDTALPSAVNPLIVLSVFLKRRRCPPHRLHRTSLAPSRLDRAHSMPLHILRIRCWGFGPKDYIPTFAFISPWEASWRGISAPNFLPPRASPLAHSDF